MHNIKNLECLQNNKNNNICKDATSHQRTLVAFFGMKCLEKKNTLYNSESFHI